MKIIIPTKGRANIIHERALRLFPDTTLCIGEDEVQAYGRHKSKLLAHPKDVVGIGRVLDPVDDPCVVMVDDDPGGRCGCAGVRTSSRRRWWIPQGLIHHTGRPARWARWRDRLVV